MKDVFDRFRSEPTDDTMRVVVDQVVGTHITNEELAYLAAVLGRSGNVLEIPQRQPKADLASTGAPTSLSTLLGPLYLRAMGFCVPKLGVPGRPAGGVDTLAQLPGYRVRLTNKEVMDCIEQCGYSHFLAGEEHAPLDARLFRYRQRSGAQAVPELTIASILSKKIAVGLDNAGLDVRVAPHGNFGATWAEARGNARRFSRIATIAGIDSVCFLTDARFPYQPFVGRGESLVALKDIFSGRRDPLLENHAKLCFAMSCATVGHPATDFHNHTKAAEKHFYDNLLAQGSSQDAFEDYASKTRREHTFGYLSKKHGFLCMKLDQLRDLFLRFQSVGVEIDVDFPDSIGIVLQKMPGDLVRPGDLIATVRVIEEQWRSVKPRLETVFSISETLEFGTGFERVLNG